jgi:hypothetical protein
VFELGGDLKVIPTPFVMIREGNTDLTVLVSLIHVIIPILVSENVAFSSLWS